MIRNPSQDWKQKKLGGKSVSLFLQIWEECTHTRASSGDEPVGIKKRTADCGQGTVRRAQGIKHGLGTKWGLETTIPDKTTWETFPHRVHFPTQQNSSKTTPLWKENPFPQFNVASHKRPGIRLSFEYTTTLLSGEGGEGRTGRATKMLSKYTIFSTVLSKIVRTGLSIKHGLGIKRGLRTVYIRQL